MCWDHFLRGQFSHRFPRIIKFLWINQKKRTRQPSTAISPAFPCLELEQNYWARAKLRIIRVQPTNAKRTSEAREWNLCRNQQKNVLEIDIPEVRPTRKRSNFIDMTHICFSKPFPNYLQDCYWKTYWKWMLKCWFLRVWFEIVQKPSKTSI